MRTTRAFAFSSALAVLALSGCRGEDDKTNDDVDITDLGDFDDGEDGGSGSGSGSDGSDDGGSGSGGSSSDGSDDGGADGTGSGTGGGTGGDDDGDEGGDPDDGGGSGSTEPPVPAYRPAEDTACFDGLAYEVQVLDSTGGACVECASGADHWVAAMIYNPCPDAYEVTLYDGYIIGGMELVNLTTGEGMGMGSGSTGRVVTETIAPGDWIGEEMWMGTLSDGDYELSVTFFDEASTRVDHTFSVD